MQECSKTESGSSKDILKSPLGKYLAPIILGMDDALVELTGALAGFTIALGNNRLIALAGLTTGIAATLSMAASEFLSQEAGNIRRNPWKAALLCGITYLLTVVILLAPFFLLEKPVPALLLSLLFAAVIIFFFTAFVSYLRKTDFLHNFIRMLVISFSVAIIAFILTWSARLLWDIEV